ncbi:unnamed protein product [Psylliodes chrysocephalus]|uniref:isopentenyl-diphosphate Delta-isomerase n=1 Tax=Psylliodes chrysocephalus TaxID=3402493 RepID=A0A9P0CYU7_9CUCU|nr:unnamed protein product [Psylliodes chrysocephala]
MLTILRCSVKRSLGRAFSSTSAAKENLDPLQEASLKETCFLVDENDKIIGRGTKMECHRVQKSGEIPLHRAFSVFLFNKKGDLLLQKRSSNKISYPNCYTNSCCSHPIADFAGEEEGTLGIKKAARRRLNYELGIPTDSVPLENLEYITRIHYKDEGNGKWGEHEIDYILFLKADVKIKPNANEISEISYVPRTELDEYIPTLNGPLTPWFQLILKNRLRFWWDNLDNIDEIKEHDSILKLKF